VAQGHVMDNIEVTSPNLSYRQPPLLLHNSRGRFTVQDAGPALKTAWAGRGAAFGDLDNDGDIDIVVANIGEKAYILRNSGGNQNGWIGIRARGRKSNADGIGCQLKVVAPSGATQYYQITTAVGYLSASDKRVVVGLGAERSAKLIEVRWPSGVIQKLENVPAGKWIEVLEPTK